MHFDPRDPLCVRSSLSLRWFNRNAYGTHFGGSLYAMCDPFFALILLRALGKEFIVWDKTASIQFLRPGKGRVTADFVVPAERGRGGPPGSTRRKASANHASRWTWSTKAGKWWPTSTSCYTSRRDRRTDVEPSLAAHRRPVLAPVRARSPACVVPKSGRRSHTHAHQDSPQRAARATATPVAIAQAVIPDLPTATLVPSLTPTYTAAPTAVPATATASPSPARADSDAAAAHAAARSRRHKAAASANPAPGPGQRFRHHRSARARPGENNGGIEGPGAGRTIFITVLDAAGNPLNGALVVNTAPWARQALSGDKGPGKAEILMDREEFRLKVQSVSGQPVTSETSHTMSLIAPVPADIAGKLGAACPTLDNCPLPPYKHFSYVITFRRTH